MNPKQVLSGSTDESLPKEARRILATLQTHSAHVPFDRLRSLVLDELGTKGQALLSTMNRKPIAAASIGQVHRAKLPSGHDVAVKIQYPGIDTAGQLPLPGRRQAGDPGLRLRARVLS